MHVYVCMDMDMGESRYIRTQDERNAVQLDP